MLPCCNFLRLLQSSKINQILKIQEKWNTIVRTSVPLISKNIAVNYLYMYYMMWHYFLRWTRRHRCWQTTTMTMAMMTRVTASSQYNWSVSKLELETGTRTTSHSAEQQWLLVYITGCCLLTTEHKISFLYIMFGICVTRTDL